MMISAKKITVAFVVLLLLGLAVMPIINGKIKDAEPSKTFSQSSSHNSITYIEASSPFDYGLKVGRKLRLEFKLLDFILGFTKKNNIDNEYIDNQINSMKQYCPASLEELKGLSLSLNIELERLISLQKSIRSIFNRMCTTTLSTGKATKNNETFLTQNLDHVLKGAGKCLGLLLLRIYSMKWWVVRIDTMGYRYAFIGIPIFTEFPLLNEKGLGFGGNANPFTENESRYIDEGPGMSMYMLQRLTMMTCKNVSEVAKLWRETERASGRYRAWPHMWDNDNTVWCDKEGGILAIEQTHNYIITVFGNSTDITGVPEDILWHANHHQWLDPNLTGSITPSEYPSTGLRAERALELLEKYYGNITLDVCKEITRDHGGGFDPNKRDSGDICRHPDKNYSVVTAISWVIQPKTLIVYLTHRGPCRSRFIKHDFSRIFK